MDNDLMIVRDLALQVRDIALDKKQEEKKLLWKNHNSLHKTNIPVIVRMGAHDAFGSEILTPDMLECKKKDFRMLEYRLRAILFKAGLDDDDPIPSWMTVGPVFGKTGWGVDISHQMSDLEYGAYKFIPVINSAADLKKLAIPEHMIDEKKTDELVTFCEGSIGDILLIERGRGNAYLSFGGDISYWLGQLIGLDNLFYWIKDNKADLHRILEFLRDGIAKIYDETDMNRDWRLTSSFNQAAVYCEELPDPKPGAGPVPCSQIWAFFAAQEFALISPKDHEEFLLDYQMPLMQRFGLIAYGCCEDLTEKITMLKNIPNLRRIAVTPWADVRKSAALIEDRYVMSWRPNPAEMICDVWDPSHIRKYITKAMEEASGCVVDITLKDVQTVKNEVWRVKEWVKIAKTVSGSF